MRRFLAMLGLAIGLLAVCTPAMAVSWGPNSSSYNGTRRVTGSGNFYNAGNTYARSKMVITDGRNDGNTVYGRTVFSFHGYQCKPDCLTKWWTDVSKSTPEFSNTTRTYWIDRGLRSWGDRARGQVFACAQMGWPVPDSCSPSSYPSFAY